MFWKLVFACLVAASLSACKEKTYTCDLSYFHAPVNPVFVGFSAAELDTIVVGTYAPNSAFDSLRNVDTFVGLNIGMAHDTARIADTSKRFSKIVSGSDYRIIVPAAGSRFQITGVHYPPDGPASEERSYQCQTGSMISEPDSIAVNGQVVKPGFEGVSYPNVFLHR